MAKKSKNYVFRVSEEELRQYAGRPDALSDYIKHRFNEWVHSLVNEKRCDCSACGGKDTRRLIERYMQGDGSMFNGYRCYKCGIVSFDVTADVDAPYNDKVMTLKECKYLNEHRFGLKPDAEK